ncbi:MAG: Mur ligase domain-containing protein, partial [Spirochaetaceae bacterium]|nr:Mur ligase domain-containing protein [Spirochaetaceae bacterium]
GMCALAELFHKAGAIVSGSDTEETFYTDSILKQLGIKYKEGFSESNLGHDYDHDYDLVIHSAAYNRETNPDIKEAVNEINLMFPAFVIASCCAVLSIILILILKAITK